MLAAADLGREIVGNFYFLLCTFPQFPNFYLVNIYHCYNQKKKYCTSFFSSRRKQGHVTGSSSAIERKMCDPC